jgi:hypothetical protein
MHKSIENKIYFLRGRKVMLDNDLAKLYGVETKNLNKAVKRNLERFPKDFMFQLTPAEDRQFSMRFQNGTAYLETGSFERESLRFQFGTLKESPLGLHNAAASKRGQHRKYLPYAFTEQGIAMLSSVLRSKQAILVNIQIMRTFTKIREMVDGNEELRINLLLSPPEKPMSEIGFRTKE